MKSAWCGAVRLVVAATFIGLTVAAAPGERPVGRLDDGLKQVVVRHRQDVEIRNARVVSRDGRRLTLGENVQVELRQATLIKGGELRPGALVQVFGTVADGDQVRASEVRVLKR